MLLCRPAVNEKINGKITRMATKASKRRYKKPMARPVGDRHSVFDIIPRVELPMKILLLVSAKIIPAKHNVQNGETRQCYEHGNTPGRCQPEIGTCKGGVINFQNG